MSVNIEGEKHLDKIRKLRLRESPDVICLQEYFPETSVQIFGTQYPYQFFVPTYKVDQDEKGLKFSTTRVWGEVIASRTPFEKTKVKYTTMDVYGSDNLPTHEIDNHIPAVLKVTTHGMQIGTTHFTWTPNGIVTDRQRAHVDELLKMIEGEEMVLAGDFNIPRGNEMYLKLAEKMKDNISSEIKTTLDPFLHYANKNTPGKLGLVVDYIWSTPKYRVQDVQVVSGVSDHCALLATVLLSK